MNKEPPENFDINLGKTLPDDCFREYNSPILNITYYDGGFAIHVNPRLKEYNFISQYDPVSAFQEISMYIGNNLVIQKDPNPKLSDDIKRDIHGFDKWSFRKFSKEKS